VADVNLSFEYTMDREDRTRSGKITPDPTAKDPKALARFGVNSAAHPELIQQGFFGPVAELGVEEMPNDEALRAAENVYKYRYFSPAGGYEIEDQGVANKFVDLCFNEGSGQATELMQEALKDVLPYLLPTLKTDGVPGPRTIAAINAAEPEQLLPALKARAVKFYEDWAAKNNKPRQLLDALIARVNS